MNATAFSSSFQYKNELFYILLPAQFPYSNTSVLCVVLFGTHANTICVHPIACTIIITSKDLMLIVMKFKFEKLKSRNVITKCEKSKSRKVHSMDAVSSSSL